MSDRVFQNDLITESLPDGRRERLVYNFLVTLRKEEIIIVRKGFVTDFASIPRLFWRFLPPWDKHKRAAMVHDWLYHGGLVYKPTGRCLKSYFYSRPTRKEADGIFLYLMKVSGVSWWKRQIIYRAVRMFGGKSYVKHPNKFKKGGPHEKA